MSKIKNKILQYLPPLLIEKFEGENFKRSFLNIGWLVIDKVLRMGVGLLVGVWLARYLGPEQYGILNYSQAFVAIFASIAGLGLDGIAVRDIVSNPKMKEEILGTSFVLKLIGGFLAVAFTLAALIFFPPQNTLTSWLILITSVGVIFQAFDTIDFWFQAEVRSKYTVYAKNTAFLLATLIKIAFILMNASLISFACLGVAEIIFGSIGMLVVYRYAGGTIKKWRTSLTQAKQLLRDSWPLILSGLVIMIYMRVDQIMIGNMLDDTAVGLYSVAVKLAEIWYFIPTAISTTVYPFLIKAKKDSEILYYRRMQMFYNFMTWLAIIVSVVMCFFSNFLVVKLFGEMYFAAGEILAINTWASIFVFQGIARGFWIQIENLQQYTFWYIMFGTLINILLNIILIPLINIKGAAIATLISQMSVAIIIPALFEKTRLSSFMLLKSFVFFMGANKKNRLKDIY